MVVYSPARLSHDDRPKVWLTFDDGPHPQWTEAVLGVLENHKIRATFFVVGASVERWGTGLLERMVALGHAIGNHTYSHPDLTRLTEAEVRDEIEATQSLIAPFAVAGRIFRPPYGALNPMVGRVARELGYRTILWNVDTRDWDPAFQPDRWVDRALDRIGRRARSIVIAHDIHPTTADHLAELIERIGPAHFERCNARKRVR
jgi:peptidoglycan/xylan/chitin deacetylase (PgdA/CDA1 family)